MDTVNKLVDERKRLETEKSEQKDKIVHLSSLNTDLNDQIADLRDIKENLEIELELKWNQIKETDEEVTELSKEKDDFKDKYIDMLNRTEGTERQIEELQANLKSVHSANQKQQESIAYLSKENDRLKSNKNELEECIDRSKDDQAKCRLETSKYLNECQKLQKELDEWNVDLNNLRDAIAEEQKQKEEALLEKADKENELNNRPKITVDDIMNHSMFKKLCNSVKQLIAEKKELEKNLEKVHSENQEMGYVNNMKKIKHFQKIKDENNFLKKELVSLF